MAGHRIFVTVRAGLTTIRKVWGFSRTPTHVYSGHCRLHLGQRSMWRLQVYEHAHLVSSDSRPRGWRYIWLGKCMSILCACTAFRVINQRLAGHDHGSRPITGCRKIPRIHWTVLGHCRCHRAHSWWNFFAVGQFALLHLKSFHLTMRGINTMLDTLPGAGFFG